MGLCFFAFGKPCGFFTSAVVFFPFCLCGPSLPCGDLERSLTRLCGSTAADSSSVYIGTCTGARSRDLDLCRLPGLPESSSGTADGSWITIGCIGGTCGVCGTGNGGIRGAVVADHHHRLSLEFVLVEALAIQIVVLITHSIHDQLLLHLSHKLVEELGASLVAGQVNLAVQEVQGVPEVCQEDQEEHQNHQRM